MSPPHVSVATDSYIVLALCGHMDDPQLIDELLLQQEP